MTTLHFPSGRVADAAARLTHDTALGSVLAVGGQVSRADNGTLVVTLHPSMLGSMSGGERMLWDLLKSVGGYERDVSLFGMAGKLDEPNRRAVHEALGLLFGVTDSEAVA